MLLSATDFASRDIFIDYPFEGAMFRWDHEKQRVFRRFYREREVEIPQDSDLFTQAIIAGREITKDEYLSGRS
jgi:hypothetical protein